MPCTVRYKCIAKVVSESLYVLFIKSSATGAGVLNDTCYLATGCCGISVILPLVRRIYGRRTVSTEVAVHVTVRKSFLTVAMTERIYLYHIAGMTCGTLIVLRTGKLAGRSSNNLTCHKGVLVIDRCGATDTEAAVVITVWEIVRGVLVSERFLLGVGCISITFRAGLVGEPASLCASRLFALVLYDSMLMHRSIYRRSILAEQLLNTLRQLITSCQDKQGEAETYEKYMRNTFSKHSHNIFLSFWVVKIPLFILSFNSLYCNIQYYHILLCKNAHKLNFPIFIYYLRAIWYNHNKKAKEGKIKCYS